MSMVLTERTLAELEREFPQLLGGLTRRRFSLPQPQNLPGRDVVSRQEQKIAPRLHHDYSTITRRLGV
ncbi:hypothetical protein [Niveispirillum lacus]|uniref:hypothetical protein n=1 Tax=Niveispirillum lacus TaxID=1981099 RepID=UPI00105662BE|nr:hypothetical protein [Niveispirillum lacus]